MTPIYERLTSDHDTHRDLLAKLAETQGGWAERRALWKSFYHALISALTLPHKKGRSTAP